MRSVWVRLALVTTLTASCAGGVPGLGNGADAPSPGPEPPPAAAGGRGSDTGDKGRGDDASRDDGSGDDGSRDHGNGDHGNGDNGHDAPSPPKFKTAVVPFILVPRFFPPQPSPLEEAQLFAFDEVTHEVFAVPGAGKGTLGPAYFGDRYFLFYRLEGGVFAYDTLTETLVRFDDVSGGRSTFRPSISRDGRTMAFLADPPEVPPVKGMFGRDTTEFTRAYLYRDGVVGELAAINTLARQEGGLDRLKLAGNGEVIAFSTNLGGVHLYTIGAEIAHKVETPPARDPAISSDGSVLAWMTGREREPRRLFATLVSTSSLPVRGPVHETATQVIMPPWWAGAPSPARSASPSPARSPAPSPSRSPAPGPPREARTLVYHRVTHPVIPIVEANLVAGPRIVSVSASKDRIQFVSYDETRGTFRWWRYVFAGSFLELLTVLNLTCFSDSPHISDVGAD